MMMNWTGFFGVLMVWWTWSFHTTVFLCGSMSCCSHRKASKGRECDTKNKAHGGNTFFFFSFLPSFYLLCASMPYLPAPPWRQKGRSMNNHGNTAPTSATDHQVWRKRRNTAVPRHGKQSLLSDTGNPYFIAHDSPLTDKSYMDGDGCSTLAATTMRGCPAGKRSPTLP